jgi:hypothetical protein
LWVQGRRAIARLIDRFYDRVALVGCLLEGEVECPVVVEVADQLAGDVGVRGGAQDRW